MAPRDLRPIVGIVAARAGRIFAILVFSVGMFSLPTLILPHLHELTRDERLIFNEAVPLALLSTVALFVVGGLSYLACKVTGCGTPIYLGRWTLIALLLFIVEVMLVPVQMARE